MDSRCAPKSSAFPMECRATSACIFAGRATHFQDARRPALPFEGNYIAWRKYVYFPRFRGYQAEWLRYDLTAGLAIAAVGLPSAIAYPAIAGLPPEVGLYSSIVPLLAYALLGSSRQLIVGPDAGTVTVLAAVFLSFGLSSTDDRIVVVGGDRRHCRAALLPGESASAWLHRQLSLATHLDRVHDRYFAYDPGRPDWPLYRRQDR